MASIHWDCGANLSLRLTNMFAPRRDTHTRTVTNCIRAEFLHGMNSVWIITMYKSCAYLVRAMIGQCARISARRSPIRFNIRIVRVRVRCTNAQARSLIKYDDWRVRTRILNGLRACVGMMQARENIQTFGRSCAARHTNVCARERHTHAAWVGAQLGLPGLRIWIRTHWP